MLQVTARENMDEWGTSAAVEQETVRAVVEAYAADKISLPTPPYLAVRRDLARLERERLAVSPSPGLYASAHGHPAARTTASQAALARSYEDRLAAIRAEHTRRTEELRAQFSAARGA